MTSLSTPWGFWHAYQWCRRGVLEVKVGGAVGPEGGAGFEGCAQEYVGAHVTSSPMRSCHRTPLDAFVQMADKRRGADARGTKAAISVVLGLAVLVLAVASDLPAGEVEASALEPSTPWQQAVFENSMACTCFRIGYFAFAAAATARACQLLRDPHSNVCVLPVLQWTSSGTTETLQN